MCVLQPKLCCPCFESIPLAKSAASRYRFHRWRVLREEHEDGRGSCGTSLFGSFYDYNICLPYGKRTCGKMEHIYYTYTCTYLYRD